jgi:hypothetical protein
MDRWTIRRAFAAGGRALGWGTLSAACGILLGLAIGVIHSPPEVPGDELANEWYPVGVMLIMFVECVVGFLAGAGIALGVRTPSGRGRVFAFALGGAVLGAGLGWVLARVFHIILIDWRDLSELASNLALQAAGAVVGIGIAQRARHSGLK